MLRDSPVTSSVDHLLLQVATVSPAMEEPSPRSGHLLWKEGTGSRGSTLGVVLLVRVHGQVWWSNPRTVEPGRPWTLWPWASHFTQ